eukprot:CAMPEP_0169197288 /NCGR_PEP_ID=MMETSP1016-20121227/8187_1 /TAXON_ID=342587 /ORGANISM="Karlodinium micrum, Strain CCMP2283" /LENGTH=81 /DNA_ID=CAMNT_0009273923 /DNA_START=104 /DNA_END=346 /DNA_ORIENTATION=-
MGWSYAISGLIGLIAQPFDAEKCGGGEDVDYLQLFVYHTLIPTGVGMGGFHIIMFRARYCKKKVGEEVVGHTVGNAGKIGS